MTHTNIEINQIVDGYRDKIFGHTNFTNIRDEVINNIYNPGDFCIISIIGPTGVGKSTLKSRIMKKIFEIEMPNMILDPAYLPVASAEAYAPERGNFDIGTIYTDFQVSLKEPLMDKKIDFDEPIKEVIQGRSTIKFNTNTLLAIRKSTINAFKERNVKAGFIDEAQEMTKTSSNRELHKNLNVIKSFSNKTAQENRPPSIIVLIGTYEFMDRVELNTQLTRRMIIIHFPRYDVKKEEDCTNFQGVLNVLGNALPMNEKPDLLNRWDYFYERTAGCVGILKSWLTTTLKETLEDGDEKKFMTIAEKRAMPIASILALSKKFMEHEKKFDNDENQKLQEQVRLVLGFTPPTNQNQDKTQPPSTKSNGNNRVGKRNPGQDHVSESPTTEYKT